MTYTIDAPLWTYLRRAAPGRRWVTWRRQHDDDGRTVKVPYQPSGRRANIAAPHTWRDAQACAQAAANGIDDGIGVVFTGGVDADGTQLIGIDIDACIDDTGGMDAAAWATVRAADTLTETSVSGRGVHLYLRVVGGVHIDGRGGRMRVVTGGPQRGGHAPAVEMFVSGCYFAATGQPWGGVRGVRTVDVDALREILSRYPRIVAAISAGPSTSATNARTRWPRAVWRALHADGRYASRSEREYAVITGMINAGWADARIVAAVTSTAPGGVIVTRLKTAADIVARRITPAQGAANVMHAAAKIRAAGHRVDVVTMRTNIDALAAHIDALTPDALTTRRAYETDRAVMLAVLHTMRTAATTTAAAAPTRDIELRLGAGVGRRTVGNALKRLTSSGWLALTTPGTCTQAATYGMGPRAIDAAAHATPVAAAHTANDADDDGHPRGHIFPTYTPALCVSGKNVSAPVSADDAAAHYVAALCTHRAIRPAAQAWRALAGVMLTPSELADALGCHVRTARRHIARLSAHGLAITDGTAYTAAMGVHVVERAAETLGIAARRDKRAAEITAERDGLRARANAAARERGAALRPLRARVRGLAIDASIDATNTTGDIMQTTLQGLYGPQSDAQGHTAPAHTGAAAARPDAQGGTVTVAVGDASVTTDAETLATLTAAHGDGIAHISAGLRAGDTGAVLTSALFGTHIVTGGPPTT